MSLIAGNLAVVQKTIETAAIPWGVYAGAAAHLYGDRRPINNVDIVVAHGSLQRIAQLLQASGNRAVQYDGNRLLWRGIYLYDDISLRYPGKVHPFTLDEQMIGRLRRMPLLGARVMVLSPEDVLIHKLIAASSPQPGKYDREDAEGIARRQKFDLNYLRERMRRANADGAVLIRLRELGIEVTESQE